MEIQLGPNSVDEPSLLYKLQRKIKVFNTSEQLPNCGYNLVASSSKYGLVFVAVPDGILTVYPLSQLVDKECEPQHITVQLQEKPTHVAVSCDSELLAVTGGQLLSVYKVADFQNSNVSPSLSIKTEVNPATFVSALQWNPCIPDSIAIAYYDGTLLACQVTNGQMKKVPSKARCICWSPKGKQLVTGNSDGTLIQYKPDLTAAKLVNAPYLFEGCPIEVMAIYWISTFQFAVVYKNAIDNCRPAVTIINTPKAGQPSCLNYEDICYSMGPNRPWFYFLQGLAQWNIIMTSSSNSMEIGTLGSTDGVNWVQWCQTDEARPELPLTDKKIENYPVGLSIDTCAIHQLPWGENDTLPHMPLLHVISQNGLLTTFNIINMKKDAVQVCSPPQLLTLPAHAMSSSIPGEAPAQPVPVAPTPVPKPEYQQPEVSPLQQALQPANTSQSGPMFGSTTNGSIKIPSFTPQPSSAFSAAPFSQVPEQKPVREIEPAPLLPPKAAVVKPKPAPVAGPKPQLTPQQAQENAALKAEQEKLNQKKVDQELKNMLIKEVNDFQMELYNFMVKTRETQIGLQRDIETINTNFNGTSIDTEQLKKECNLEELRGAIVQLKLELVRACAVVAEARTHSDAKDYHQWMQADPLTTKRVASVKKLAYYVQSQLEQAHKALDLKWDKLDSKAIRDPFNNPGKRMIRPILDDVYQPLVKQQEILSRQQAILRTLKNTLSECDLGPVFKSTSLLRSTPFRNNKDPLSKLTKNILNMSIEPQTKPKQSLLNAQKLDALRDVLSNHKTVKIKPVNVEMGQHLANMRKNYEMSLKERSQAVSLKREHDVKPVVQPAPAMSKIEPKKEPFSPQSYVKPVAAPLANVARTLFTDEPKPQPPQPQPQVQRPFSKPFGFSANTTAPGASPIDTKSALKDLLTNKQASLEAKNTFMGQKICSPTAFGQPTAPKMASAPSAVFTSKPIVDIDNMFNKFQSQQLAPEIKSSINTKPEAQTFGTEVKSTLNAKTEIKSSMPESKSALNAKPVEKTPTILPNVKSSETGEPEETGDAPKPVDFQSKDKPITKHFAMKPTPVAASTPVIPTTSKSSIQDQKSESKITVKTLENLKTKENVPDKSDENVPRAVAKVAEKKELKPLSAQTANKSFVFGASQPIETTSAEVASSEPKPLDVKTEAKTEIKKVTDKPNIAASKESSVFASTNAANITVPKPQPAFTSPVTITKTEDTTKSSETDSTSTDLSSASSASSIFGAAVASQPKTTSSIFSSSPTSVFSSTPQTSEPSVFGTTKPSIFSSSTPAFGTATTASSVFGQTNTTQSVFSSTAASVFASASSSQPPSPSVTPSAFGAITTATTPIFGTSATTASSVFGSATSTSVFGTATTPAPAATQPTSSVFGTSPTQASVFGATTTASVASVFGASPTTQSSVFGSTEAVPSAFTATTTSIFGTATTTASIFSTATTQASVFGQTAQSVFGATTQASIFGSTSTPSVFGTPTSQTSVFGTPAVTTQTSVFGTPTQTTQSSIFGTPTQSTQASIFGTPTQTTQASVFGTPPQTTQASIFGQAPANAQSGSLFGGGEANLFASASISTTSAPTQATGGNIFGGSSSGSVFGGGGTNVFGGKAAFGQPNQTATNIFGGGTSFGQKSPTNIWGSGNTAGGGFGSSGFGQQATTQASSIFGGTTGGSFSQPSAGAFGTPQQQPAFGSPPQQQPAPAFGGSSVFGAKPVFGQSAGFGSSPSGGFGAPATFGGFNKSPGGSGFGAPAFGGGSGFGSGSTGSGFGSPTQSNATFENLATQNTLTFGNLAQQSTQQASPSFNTSPSFTGWRG